MIITLKHPNSGREFDVDSDEVAAVHQKSGWTIVARDGVRVEEEPAAPAAPTGNAPTAKASAVPSANPATPSPEV